MSIEHTKDNIKLLEENLFNQLTMYFSSYDGDKIDMKNFKELFQYYLTALIKTEFELYITNPETKNYKNGYSTRTVKTLYGEVEIKVPRDRDGNYNSQILTKYSQTTEELSKVILQLFQFGLSHSDVCTFINNIYGIKYSRQSISSITKVTNEIVVEFNRRKLSKKYIALFMDATYIPIKFDNKASKQAVQLVVAINEFGHQEIIAYSIGFRETKVLWSEIIDDIKNRGVNEVDIVIIDGFLGLDKVIKSRLPNTKIQRCTVHVLRNIFDKVIINDIPAVKADFSILFKNTDKNSFDIQLKFLLKKYKKYSTSINKIFEDENITTYLEFPVLMQRTIKTNNRIESVNQKIKTRIKFKQSFQNKESFERTLVSSIIIQNNNSDKPVGGLIDYLRRKKK